MSEKVQTDAKDVEAASLHVFRNECDWYVAASPTDAAQAYRDFVGDDPDPDDPFELLDDDRPLTITSDPDARKPEKVTKTCAEWARSNGRGFLCSTEY